MKHKFINKKTGAEARVIAMYLDSDGVMQVDGYDAVEDLMDDYAAYEEYNPPKEPLIKDKDEEARKAIRAFSEATHEKKILVVKQFGRGSLQFSCGATFWIKLPLSYETMDALEDGTYYTIDELCGEEEK